jgi:acetylglutamate kinase
MDANDDATVIGTINPQSYKKLKEDNVIFAGMIPKLDNAFAAIGKGVREVIIGKAEKISDLISGNKGTKIQSSQHL